MIAADKSIERTQWEIEDTIDEFQKRNPEIRCKNCIAYGNDGYCYVTDKHELINDEGFCSDFMLANVC